MITEQQIVDQARTWLGTIFYHQGRSKKTATMSGGVDCLGLVAGVVDELGIKAKDGITPLINFDDTNYSSLPSGDRLIAELDKHFIKVDPADMQLADIVLFRLLDDPQHVGFVGDYVHGGFSLIHTYQGADKVVEHCFDAAWKRRIVSVYRFYPESLGNA